MRIQVDTGVCVGAGMCALTAPAVFDQDDIGLVTVLDGSPAAEHHVAVRQAVQLCPSGALKLAQDD